MNIKTPNMQELLEAGVHFGHKISRGNPRMKRYIFGSRDGVHIIDLAQSEELLKEAVNAAFELGKAGGVMLLVGTKKQSQQIIEDLATEANTPFLNHTWVPGLFTNFEEVKKNVKRLNELKEEQAKGTLSRYTKREQLLMSRKLEKFGKVLGGAAGMAKIPEAIFVVDAVSDNTAIKEALKLNVKIFGICDTNADPNWFDFPVPGNDDGIKAIKMLCETVIKAYAAGKKEGGHTVGEAKKEEIKETKKAAKAEEKAEEALVLDEAVAEEAAIIEEEVEKKVVAEAGKKV